MPSQPAAILTDATHFVGHALARTLAHRGYAVYAVDARFRDEDARTDFAAGVKGVMAIEMQSAADVAEEVESRHGRIDLLVGNDAWPAACAPIDEVASVALHETFEALVFKPFAFATEAAKRMKPHNRGKMVFLTSAAPLQGLANYSMYCAARGAMNAAVKALARELAPFNIQVNAVAPNFIANPDYFPPELMADPAKAAKILKNIPLGRLGEPDEVAAMVAHLASDEAGFFTGQVIAAAGGWA